jgi:hypothetical protein
MEASITSNQAKVPTKIDPITAVQESIGKTKIALHVKNNRPFLFLSLTG